MTQKTELPALPEPRLWYDPETQRCSSMAPLRPTYISLWDEDDLRAYATAAVLAERERQQSLHMRRLTGLWRFGREVLPVANISFEAFLFQLDGFIDEKTMAHPLTPPAVKEG